MLLLASQSPRRKELLKQMGVRFEAFATEIDETAHIGESPTDYVKRIALEKALVGRSATVGKGSGPVLGADTSVIVGDSILGKPDTAAKAQSMLARLSGRSHQVITAIALALSDGEVLTDLAVTEVFFRALDAAEIEAYCETGEPFDKAGGYGIQGYGAVFVERIIGNYSTVVGLPILETAGLLRQADIEIWQNLDSVGHNA